MGDDSMTADVSVIICAYTEERLADIREAVASVQQQTKRPTEIIVAVDNNSSLWTKLQRELKGPVRVVLNREAKGLSPTRNFGVDNAGGSLIAFLDDDAVAEPDWLEKLLVHFDDPNVYVAGGKAVLAWSQGRPVWFPEELDWTVGGSFTWMPQRSAVVTNPHGHNMCFRREAFSAAGMFDTAVGRNGNGGQAGEEREFCLRLISSVPEARIIYEPAAIVRHKVPPSRSRWGYLLKRSYGEGLCKAYIEQKSRSFSRAPLSTEWRYLRHLVFRAIPLRMARFYRPQALAHTIAIVLGIAAAGGGYLAGRWQYRKMFENGQGPT